MLDMCYRCDKDNKITYVWFDTGLEYQATKDHINYLEHKYNIEIVRYKAKKPIPIVCKEYGEPFLSKKISDYMSRLQRHDFQWEDENFEDLYIKYPKCKSALSWWCNANKPGSMFNINKRMWLKEFLLSNHPDFKISSKCCQFAKKDVVHDCVKEYNPDLNIYGVRKSEGGLRATLYKNCFSEYLDKADEYRPLFFFKDKDKVDFEMIFNITHSDCYSKYGLVRTGCTGCPFNLRLWDELNIIKLNEPKLYKAANSIFKNSYRYTELYKKFCEEMKKKYGSYAQYLRNKK